MCTVTQVRTLLLTTPIMMSIENHLVRLDVGRQSNSVQTYGVNCRSKRRSLPLLASSTIQHHKKYTSHSHAIITQTCFCG